MKKLNSNNLLELLENDTRQIILTLRQLQQQDPELLQKSPATGKWSVVQVIEHLNTYGRYYLPLIRKAIAESKHTYEPSYTPGWLGNYFVNSMLPAQNGTIKNKMKAFKNHIPSPDMDSHTVLSEFLKQEEELLQLLSKAKSVNLGKIRIPISIAAFIKLKLGDTFRFFIAHHQRHFVQISNTLAALSHPSS
ncbi:MAG: DinB family protein [Pseudobacter sp.]|uniref:DinB family protein n=1 Tax=Pseudobacter sp. TaxID=2045420 RepID=UPI003F7E9873